MPLSYGRPGLCSSAALWFLRRASDLMFSRQIGIVTAHVRLDVRPAGHATADPGVAQGLDVAALVR